MSDAPRPVPPGAGAPVPRRPGGQHFHDWRVDPSQVIVMLCNESRFRIGCAGCSTTAVVTSSPSPPPRPDDRRTWRAYRPKRGDTVTVEGGAT